MISAATFFSSSTMTWDRMAPRFRTVFLVLANLLRRAARTAGMMSSTIRMVLSSRQVVSAAPPVVVRVVMPRTGEITPAWLSRGVTPPRTSRSMSLSL